MSSVDNTTASIMAVAKRFSVRSGKRRKTPSIGTTGKAGILPLFTTLPTSTQRPVPRSNVLSLSQFFRMGNGAPPHSNNLTSIPPRPIWRGFSFALHPTRCRAFVLPCCNIAPYKRLQRVLCCSCNLYRTRHKTAHGALQALFRLFAVFYACYLAVYPAMLYSLQGAGGHTSAQSAYTNTRYHRHTGRCTAQHSRPIIIRYVRGCNISQTTQSRRGQLLPSADRWQVLTRCQQYRPGAPAEGSASQPVQGQPGTSTRRGNPAAGGAEPLTAVAVSLFGLSPDSQ